jgi:extracellular elastinolytic metalloproteinase
MEQVVSRRAASPENAMTIGNAHRRPTGRLRLMATITACALTLPVGSAWAQTSQRLGQHDHGRNFDARVEVQEQLRQELPQPAQEAALEALRREVPDLLVHRDHATGTVKSLVAATGFLTSRPLVGDPESIALDFVHQNLEALGLSMADVAERELTDSVYSDLSGTTHLYYRQMHQGIPVYNGQLHVNVSREGHVLGVHNAFLPGLSAAAAARGTQPSITAAQAVDRAVLHAGLATGQSALALSTGDDPGRRPGSSPTGVSRSPIEAQLMLAAGRPRQRPAGVELQPQTPDGEHAYDLTVDAHTGKVWTRFDWCRRRHLPGLPAAGREPEPHQPAPPSDGRVLVTDPHNAATNASPNGWHSTGSTSFTILRGNNVARL